MVPPVSSVGVSGQVPPAYGFIRRSVQGLPPSAGMSPTGRPVSGQESGELREMKERDREVRAHEQAHHRAAGRHAKSGPKYDYQVGPNGRLYAVGGHVDVDVSRVPGDPEATIRKMETIRKAALAPEEPSQKDREVARQAEKLQQEAKQELQAERRQEASGASSGIAHGPPGTAQYPNPAHTTVSALIGGTPRSAGDPIFVDIIV